MLAVNSDNPSKASDTVAHRVHPGLGVISPSPKEQQVRQRRRDVAPAAGALSREADAEGALRPRALPAPARALPRSTQRVWSAGGRLPFAARQDRREAPGSAEQRFAYGVAQIAGGARLKQILEYFAKRKRDNKNTRESRPRTEHARPDPNLSKMFQCERINAYVLLHTKRSTYSRRSIKQCLH